MRSDFSRTTAFFQLGQEIIESVRELGREGPFEAFAIDKVSIDKACLRCLGREVREGEWEKVTAVVGEVIADFSEACSVYNLAHMLYHAMED